MGLGKFEINWVWAKFEFVQLGFEMLISGLGKFGIKTTLGLGIIEKSQLWVWENLRFINFWDWANLRFNNFGFGQV